MMKFVTTLILLFCTIGLFSQTSDLGFNYQAVARAADGEILPNKELSMKVQIISDFRTKKIAFEEIHYVKSDQLGIINTIIGKGELIEGSFDEIPWDKQSIWVNIMLDIDNVGDFGQNNYAQLLAVPYAMYALEAGKVSEKADGRGGDINVPTNAVFWTIEGNEIIQDEGDRMGTINAADVIFITSDIERARISSKGEFSVEKNLTVRGALDVSEFGAFHEVVTFDKDVSIGENLIGVGNVYLKADLEVEGITRNLNKTDASSINTGSVIIDGGVGIEKNLHVGAEFHATRGTNNSGLVVNGENSGENENWDSYPVQVTGEKQGVAIKITEGPNSENDFVSFFNNDDEVVGRIEGQTKSEILSDEDYKVQTSFLAAAVASSIAALVHGTATKGSAVLKVATFLKDIIVKLIELIGSGIASVVAGAGVADFIGNTLKNIMDGGFTAVKLSGSVIADFFEFVITAFDASTNVANFIQYQILIFQNAGASFQSGSADYAEWLRKENVTDKFKPGDVVGIKQGRISHDVEGAQQIMVISSDPIVLGNMPLKEDEHLYEKVAFMGQVPVKVNGPVQSGDYLLAMKDGSGFAEAVSPENITLESCKNIVGVSWGSSELHGINYVNTAIGLNKNDVIPVLENQVKEMDKLKMEMNEVKKYILENEAILAELVPGYKERLRNNKFEIEEDLLLKSNEAIESVAMGSIQENIAENNLYEIIDSYTELRRGDSYKLPTDNSQIMSMINTIDSKHNIDLSVFNTTAVGPFDQIESAAQQLLDKDYIAEFKTLITSGVSVAVQLVADQILEVKDQMLNEIAAGGELTAAEKTMLDEKLNEFLPIFEAMENSDDLVQETVDGIFDIIDEAACAVCNEIDALPVHPNDIADAVIVPSMFLIDVVDYFVGTLDVFQNLCIGACIPVGVTDVCFDICPFGFLPDIDFEVDDLPFVDNKEINIQFPDMCATLNCN